MASSGSWPCSTRPGLSARKRRVKLSGRKSDLEGIPVSALSGDQKELVRKVKADVLAPFRKVDAEFVAAHGERLWQHDAPLDRGGRARLLVPDPGQYEIRWWLDTGRDSSPAAVPPHRSRCDQRDRPRVETSVRLQR